MVSEPMPDSVAMCRPSVLLSTNRSITECVGDACYFRVEGGAAGTADRSVPRWTEDAAAVTVATAGVVRDARGHIARQHASGR